MNTYFALTIGPIYKTLSQAQRTREFWGSSYMFSWIMREIIVGMIKKTTIIDEDILMPHRDEHTNLQKGTGLYHDRMIAVIKSDKKDQILKDFKDTADAVLKQIEAKSGVPLNVLKSYFRLNAVLLDLDEKQNIVETITNYLDSLELQNPIFHDAWKFDWSDAIDNLNGKFFYKDAFGDHPDFVFDSIPEISSRGLRSENDKEYDQLVKTYITDKFINKRRFPKKIESDIQDKFITQLSGSNLLKDHFRNYHKYIAIVHADGDNLGETIRKIGDKVEDVKKLSKALFRFASKAVGVIGSYGGTNVYAGGDDLLFFEPVATVNPSEKQTIFHLV
ncbi:MAG: type III-B CRISPR-associated protein Cas10/Cmr2, partial [Ignavibacteria bacterium]|nr:type III-B CRISPR-associated protein Cas10/Cmr2 [Ignavibacteria bacterium]